MKVDIPLNKETKPNQTKLKTMKVDILLHKETKPNPTEPNQNPWRLMCYSTKNETKPNLWKLIWY